MASIPLPRYSFPETDHAADRRAQQRPTQPVTDRFDRHVSYVRISVTDRCDFRRVSWMSEQMTLLPRAEVLTLEELAPVARAFVELGVTKIRLTGE